MLGEKKDVVFWLMEKRKVQLLEGMLNTEKNHRPCGSLNIPRQETGGPAQGATPPD